VTEIREGMKVRSSDNRRLGRVVAVEAAGIAIEKGVFFHRRVFAPWADVVGVEDGRVVVATHRPSLGELNQAST
jgi:hypothetical protein